jgi:predicted O-methyltransferase YrrM
MIKTREDFPGYLNEHCLVGISVEIGVAFGWYSMEFCSKWQGLRHYAVDSWHDESINEKKEFGNARYKTALEFLEKDKRIVPMRMESLEAAKLFDNSFFDFIYIDACHDYDNVIADIKAWLPKLRAKGIIAGHDIDTVGVQKAVKEIFGGNFKRTQDTLYAEHKADSWYVEVGI